MFASLAQSKKTSPSETTPLLAALQRYRNRQNGVDEADDDGEAAVMAQYGGEEEEEDEDREDEDRQRDGPLLPVFSSTFLGMSAVCTVFCLHD
jgi:hypothetical protein